MLRPFHVAVPARNLPIIVTSAHHPRERGAEEVRMSNFTPLSAAIGGALIGLSASLLMLLTGRIAGVSGILGGALGRATPDTYWRLAFIAGLILAPLTATFA